MGALSIENDLMIYWLQLSEENKVDLISVAKEMAENKDKFILPKQHWEKLLKQREAHRSGEKGYSWEQVKAMAKNQTQRNGLPS